MDILSAGCAIPEKNCLYIAVVYKTRMVTLMRWLLPLQPLEWMDRIIFDILRRYRRKFKRLSANMGWAIYVPKGLTHGLVIHVRCG